MTSEQRFDEKFSKTAIELFVETSRALQEILNDRCLKMRMRMMDLYEQLAVEDQK